jgi:excisionase family DNA binding protein
MSDGPRDVDPQRRPHGAPRFFTTSEVARYCAVSNDGVLRWIKAGKLRGFATPGGHYRIPADAFREFLERFEIPVQEEFFGSDTGAPRLLIADDDEGRRAEIRKQVERADDRIVVLESAAGYDAGIGLGALAPDVVVLDLGSNAAGAIELCRSVRANHATRGVRVVLLVGSATEAKTGYAAGASACLSRPLNVEELRHELGSLLAPRRPAGDAGTSRSHRRPAEETR